MIRIIINPILYNYSSPTRAMKDTCGYIVYIIYVPVSYIIYYTTLGIVFNVYFNHNDKKWFINTGKCSLSAEIVGNKTCGSPLSYYLVL